MNEQMLAGMREALSLLQGDGAIAATEKIQQTLRDLISVGGWAGNPAARGEGAPAPNRTTDLVGPIGGFGPNLPAGLGRAAPPAAGGSAAPVSALRVPLDRGTPPVGRFLAGSFTNQAGTRAYRLYIPATYRDQPVPLVVMLHGCGQGPDEFAADTGWNLIAEHEPCLVLYPAQAQSANATRCWNWFNAGDQQRDQGEPAIIAGMTREVMASYRVDPARVYCAGLSAGGAMAVIMGATYHDLYAAIGSHSGLPYAAATNLVSALAAMQRGGTGRADADLQGLPIIVFHGDRDDTIHPHNSDLIVAQFIPAPAATRVNTGQDGGGHTYTQRVHEGPGGKVLAEHWLVHGAGHAWSGGNGRSGFTDGRGPDASREMMRFFAAQARPT